MSDFLDAALHYRKLGLHPVPVEPRGKRPILSTWREYVARQPTEDDLRRWWTETPEANVALLLGRGTFAVDIDGPEGEAALAAAGVKLPKDAVSSATGRGRHVFFTGHAANAVGVLPKVDVRSDGGYVVVPPSVHPNGARYEWLVVPDVGMEPAPAALMGVLARPTRPALDRKVDNWLTSALAGAGEGTRDDICTRLAGYFLGKGVPAEAVEALLQTWADRCTPPFPADQVAKCVESIARREGPVAGPPAGIEAVVDLAVQCIRHPLPGRATALGGLDSILAGGFQPGELVYLGARPSVGKTAFALQVAREVARKGLGALIVTREMTPVALVRRMLAQESLVRATALKTGALVDVEWAMLEVGAARLRALPLWVTSTAVTVEQIEEAVASYGPGELKFLIVDYLQLVRAPSDVRDRRAGIEHVSKALKALAIQYDLPVLCLSSLTRPPKDASANWRPVLADLRESGELEHDADIVLLMHRDAQSGLHELNVAKNRDGVVGVVKLKFDDFLRFTEVPA